jgi:hypothetical protein
MSTAWELTRKEHDFLGYLRTLFQHKRLYSVKGDGKMNMNGDKLRI